MFDYRPREARVMPVALGALFCVTFLACHSAGPVGAGAVGPAHPAQGPVFEVVVRPDQFGQTLTISPSQTLRLPRPADAPEWRLSYATEVLELLTPPDQAQRPAPDGWRFRAVSEGETALVLTTVSPPCPGGTPCSAPPPVQFALTVRVSR